MPKQELLFRNPITNYPGSLGFSPDFKRLPETKHLGAFFTNPISRHSRQPAAERYAVLHYGTLAMHTGHPNPGIRQTIRLNANRWADSPLPIVPQLWIETLEDLPEMLQMLEPLPGLCAISIAFAPDLSTDSILGFFQHLECELPLILQGSAASLITYSRQLRDSVVSGLSLTANRGVPAQPGAQTPSGRLFGPSLFLQTLQSIREITPTPILLVAAGGIYTAEEVKACLVAGASAVQLDTAFWNGIAESILKEFNSACS